MQLKPGDRIGDYEVLGVLGAGGMGSVYKVRNTISDRVEALKLLLPNLVEHPDLKERFLREIKTSASLEHPCIASLRTAFQSGDMLLMVMEFVEGQTLDDRLREGPLPIEESIRVTAAVLEALDYAHSRGVVHRDIKPANIMLARGGGVKLLDFGIAKATTDKQITVAGTTLGSLYYMSPEQIRGEQVDARADIYSLGITLYELTTGKRPFAGDSGYAIMAEHLQKQPVPPIQIAPGVPASLSAVILRSLAKTADERYPTAAAFRKELMQVLEPEEATRVHASAAVPADTVQSPAVQASTDPSLSPFGMRQEDTPPPQPTAAMPPAPAAVPAAPIPSTPAQQQIAPQASPGFASAHSPVETKKSTSALALVMVALITFLVLAAVVVVFAGSWFLGSSDTAVASNDHGLMQRLGSLFATSNQGEDEAAVSDGPTEEELRALAEEMEAAENDAALQASTAADAQPTPSREATASPVAGSSAAANTASRQQEARPAEQIVTAQLAPQQSAPPPPQAPAPSAPPAKAPPEEATDQGPDPVALERMQDFFSKLGIRAGTIQESARKLTEEQSRQGVGLRADIRASLKRMEYLMDEAEASMNRGNLLRARRQMRNAEREIERLEKFFRI
jgi:eukaryotic-like serine/threonine-protein kinase